MAETVVLRQRYPLVCKASQAGRLWRYHRRRFLPVARVDGRVVATWGLPAEVVTLRPLEPGE